MAWLVALHGRELQAWNAGERPGYAAPRWKNSESVQYIRKAALAGAVLSNAMPVTSLHTDSPARHYRLPCEPDHLWSALSNAFDSGEVHVLYFNDWWEECSRQQDDDLRNALTRSPLLELVAELADGKLYRLREQESWPAAIFYSSGAPVESKSFVAFLNKSHGQRLPGEPWRWEKDSDADGWTSLPVQRPTYAYTPTVADVGYRLRALVYYADHFGNRVEAITEPSEPVQPDILKALALLGSEDGRSAAGASEMDRIITSRYDVYLYGNRLIYRNRSCIWEDEYGARFPLIVYSLDSESGTPERDTLDFEWRRNFWKNNGTCIAERQLPDQDLVGIQTGQVDRDENLLWEAGRWFDGYLSSVTFGEPATRNVFDIYLGKGNLSFVKDSCARADTEARFFLHLIPADVNDLPDHRKQHGFDNLDFYFDQHGDRFDGKCLAIRALPEYDIVGVSVGQFEGNSRFWEAEISVP